MKARFWVLMLCCLAPLAQAQSFDKQALLEQIRETRSTEQAAMREREQRFLRERNQQQARLSQTRAELTSAQARADELDALFKAQSEQLAQLRQELTERSGNLGELFGVVRQGAGDTLSQWQDSLLNARYPERQRELEALSQSSRIPSVEVLEQFWYRLQQDMNASGEVARFSAPLIDRQGNQQAQPVVAVGPFVAVAGDEYLLYQADSQALQVAARQPDGVGLLADFLAPREAVAGICVPAAILAWTEDPAHPLSTAQALHDLIPGSHLVVAATPADLSTWPGRLHDQVVAVSGRES